MESFYKYLTLKLDCYTHPPPVITFFMVHNTLFGTFNQVPMRSVLTEQPYVVEMRLNLLIIPDVENIFPLHLQINLIFLKTLFIDE